MSFSIFSAWDDIYPWCESVFLRCSKKMDILFVFILFVSFYWLIETIDVERCQWTLLIIYCGSMCASPLLICWSENSFFPCVFLGVVNLFRLKDFVLFVFYLFDAFCTARIANRCWLNLINKPKEWGNPHRTTQEKTTNTVHWSLNINGLNVPVKGN